MKNLLIILFLSIFFLAGCNNNPQSNNSEESTHISNTEYIAQTLSNDSPKEETLSSFSTPVNYPEEVNRQINMKLCCDTLSGFIVKAGEEFSFCETVGQATPEKGYKEADVFDMDGNVQTDYGGGKCQVSSTLYNAVLAIPTLEVTERHPHTHKVYYVEEGKDACISYGGADFKFKNNSNFDIKIYAENNYYTIDVSIVKLSS